MPNVDIQYLFRQVITLQKASWTGYTDSILTSTVNMPVSVSMPNAITSVSDVDTPYMSDADTLDVGRW